MATIAVNIIRCSICRISFCGLWAAKLQLFWQIAVQLFKFNVIFQHPLRHLILICYFLFCLSGQLHTGGSGGYGSGDAASVNLLQIAIDIEL